MGDASRLQLHLQRNLQNGDLAWGCYNSRDNRSEIFFTSNETNTNLYPARLMSYAWDNHSLFESATSLDWAGGFEMQDVETAVTWDSLAYTWDQYDVQWDQADIGAEVRRVLVVSSNGTPYRFRSDATNDDGQTIDARWRSHAMGQGDAFRYETMYEVWMNYNSASTSTIGVHVSGDHGRTFSSAFTRALSASSVSVVMFPVFVTAQSPMFEVRVADGSQPKLSQFQVRLRDAGLHGGTR